MKHDTRGLHFRRQGVAALALAAALFAHSPLAAAPSVVSVEGMPAHGGTMTVRGSGFGQKVPAGPLLWDDGETRSVNDPAAVSAIYADREQRGGWARRTGDADYYDIQYRSAPFRGMQGPHAWSRRFLAGSHSNYRDTSDGGYRWTRSSRGTNEYFCEAAGGGDPQWNPTVISAGPKAGRSEIFYVKMDDLYLREGTVGSLVDHQWDWADNDGLGYNTVYVRDNSGDPDLTGVHILAGVYRYANSGNNVGVTFDTGASQSRWFMSYYAAVDPLWPNDGGTDSNHKYLVFETQGRVYSSNFWYFDMPHSHTPDHNPGSIVGYKAPPGCSESYNPCAANRQFCQPTPVGNWQKHTLEVDFGRFYYHWVDGGLAAYVDSCDYNEGTARRAFTFGGYACYCKSGAPHDVPGCCQDNDKKDGHQDMFRYFDDLYLDNTFARVVLADSGNLASARIIEPQIPVTWSDGSITVRVNRGRIPSVGRAYLFVFDGNNQHNATGYPVGDDVPPDPPHVRE